MPKQNQAAVMFWTLCALAGPVLVDAQAAYAHKLKLFATAEGKTISGYAYLSGGARLRDQMVQVLSPGGDNLGEAKTNDNGEFVFMATYKCDHLLRIDAGDGHGASFVVKADELPDDLPVLGVPVKDAAETSAEAMATDRIGQPASSTETEKVIAKALGKQIRPLREQLDRLEDRIHLRDVLGGIGYILGIAGIAFYFLGRRKAENSKAPPDRPHSR